MGENIVGWTDIETANRQDSTRLTNRELGVLADEELMKLLRQGHHESLSHLFDRYHRLVLAVTSKVIHNRAEAEDLMQEVFFDVYRFADRFDPAKGTVRGWIIQFAFHKGLNRRKYLALRGEFENQQIEQFDLPGVCAQNGHASSEIMAVVQQGLATLPPHQREAVQLVCFDGFLLREIAERKKESLGNVRHHYYRGIEKLRAFVNRNLYPEKRRDAQGGAR